MQRVHWNILKYIFDRTKVGVSIQSPVVMLNGITVSTDQVGECSEENTKGNQDPKPRFASDPCPYENENHEPALGSVTNCVSH